MVRIQKLAVTDFGKDKKYICRTSRYASARVWVGSTCPWVDPTFTWVDSNIPWVDPLRKHRNLKFQPSFPWVDPTILWVDSKFTWVDSNSSWVDPLSNSREPFSVCLSVLPLGRPSQGLGRLKLGSTQPLCGSTLSVTPESIFPWHFEVLWRLGRLMLTLGRPNSLFICAIFAGVCQMTSWCTGVDPINLWVDSIHTLLHSQG